MAEDGQSSGPSVVGDCSNIEQVVRNWVPRDFCILICARFPPELQNIRSGDCRAASAHSSSTIRRAVLSSSGSLRVITSHTIEESTES